MSLTPFARWLIAVGCIAGAVSLRAGWRDAAFAVLVLTVLWLAHAEVRRYGR